MVSIDVIEEEVESINAWNDDVFTPDNTDVIQYAVARERGASRDKLRVIAEEVDEMCVDDSFLLERYWKERRLGRDGKNSNLNFGFEFAR